MSVARSEAVVFETYPVLAIIALGWLREDSRVGGRLPKYNPGRTKTFSVDDWQYLCSEASQAFRERRLVGIARWIDEVRDWERPRKSDQDKLDACICLPVALHMSEQRDSLMVGNCQTGYVVVPHCSDLQKELEARCGVTTRSPPDWVRMFKLAIAK